MQFRLQPEADGTAIYITRPDGHADCCRSPAPEYRCDASPMDRCLVEWAQTTLLREGTTVAGYRYTLEDCLKASPDWWITWHEEGPIVKGYEPVTNVMRWHRPTLEEIRPLLIQLAQCRPGEAHLPDLRLDVGYLDCYDGQSAILELINSHPEVPMTSVRTGRVELLPREVDSLVLEMAPLPATTTVHHYLGLDAIMGSPREMRQMTARIPIIHLSLREHPVSLPRLGAEQCLQLTLGECCLCSHLLGERVGTRHRCTNPETRVMSAIQILQRCRPGWGLLVDPGPGGEVYPAVRDGDSYRLLEDRDVSRMPFYYLYEPSYQHNPTYRQLVDQHLMLLTGQRVYVINPEGGPSSVDYPGWRHLGRRVGLCRVLVREHLKRSRPAELLGDGQAPPTPIRPLLCY